MRRLLMRRLSSDGNVRGVGDFVVDFESQLRRSKRCDLLRERRGVSNDMSGIKSSLVVDIGWRSDLESVHGIVSWRRSIEGFERYSAGGPSLARIVSQCCHRASERRWVVKPQLHGLDALNYLVEASLERG